MSNKWEVKPHPKLRLWEIWQGLLKVAECDNEAIAKMIACDFNNRVPMSSEELSNAKELRDTIAPIADALVQEVALANSLQADLDEARELLERWATTFPSIEDEGRAVPLHYEMIDYLKRTGAN